MCLVVVNEGSSNTRLSKRDRLIEKIKKVMKETMSIMGLDYDMRSKTYDARMDLRVIKNVAEILNIKPEKGANYGRKRKSRSG